MKVGDLVQLKATYQASRAVRLHALPVFGIIDWVHPNNDLYIKLLSMRVEVLTKYYEVINENR